MSPSRKVRMGGEIFLYKAKEPFVQSGESLQGALEYDDVEDKVRCHECGEWRSSLGGHIWTRHSMTAAEYKDKHGLFRSSALCSEGIRLKLIAHGRSSKTVLDGAKKGLSLIGPGRRYEGANCSVGRLRHEKRNKLGTCKAQLLEKLAVLGKKLGRRPTRQEMLAAGIGPQSMEHSFGIKLSEIMPLVGLLPYHHSSRRRYTKELLAELMRDFWVKHQRVPSGSDYRRGLLPCYGTYLAYFGTMEKAYFVAGLELEVAKARKERLASQKRSPVYSEAELLGMLRQWMQANGRRPREGDFGSEMLPPMSKTFRRRLGSLPVVLMDLERKNGPGQQAGGGVLPCPGSLR